MHKTELKTTHRHYGAVTVLAIIIAVTPALPREQVDQFPSVTGKSGCPQCSNSFK